MLQRAAIGIGHSEKRGWGNLGFFPPICLYLKEGKKETCMTDGNGKPICVQFTGETAQGHIILVK